MTVFLRRLLLFVLLASLPLAGHCGSIWDDFLLKPNNKTLAQIRVAIEHDLKRCEEGILPTDIQISKLLKLIEDGNSAAFQAGMLVSSCIGVGDLEDFYRSAGVYLVVQPKEFLRIVNGRPASERELRYMVTMLPLTLVDNSSGQLAEVNHRISILKRVEDDSLTMVKNKALSFLEDRRKKLKSESN